jgi:endonuclease/exonuclease/phosphatase family metal-dependent hydrolase
VIERPGIARILTWNIHSGIGPDRTYDLDRVVELVRRHDPDIVALQEVDSRGRDADDLPLPFLKEALGEHAAEARTIVAPDGHYGHVVLSRWPMTRVKVHDLSMLRREPRCAIETTIETPSGPLHLVSTHLGLGIFERKRQARLLAELGRAGAEPTVMLGDFNDWFQWGSVRRALADVMPARTMHKTFPAQWPFLMLDRIYCRPYSALTRSWTDRMARGISDHLPVFADIRVD